MFTKNNNSHSGEPLNILLIGNNPIDMSGIIDKIKQIRGRKVVTEIAFDLKSIVERLMSFRPNFIVIDDNIGKVQLTETVQTLSTRNRTKNIPITVLKNSNYEESGPAAGFFDYILKTNLSGESLFSTLRNSSKFRKTQQLLFRSYNRRRGLLNRLQT